VRVAVVVEGYEFAVEHEPGRELGELGQSRGHVPAAPTPHSQVVGRAQGAEAVPLDVERPASPGRPAAESIGEAGSGTERI
jgi:hypothetical protein